MPEITFVYEHKRVYIPDWEDGDGVPDLEHNVLARNQKEELIGFTVANIYWINRKKVLVYLTKPVKIGSFFEE